VSGEPILELAGIHKAFGLIKVIQGANLTVRQGERHALIGPNGAGKSTLFNIISGRFPPTAGEVRLRGERIDRLAPETINRRGLARSFQITSIFPRLSAFENLRIAAMPRFGIRFSMTRALDSHSAINNLAQELLDAVRLSARRDTLAGELPYSEQRALEIALTLASDPDVILLDEPTSGMSRNEALYITDLVRTLTRDRTLLVVEHDMDVVFKLCDRISVLVYGRVLASGTPEEIQSDHAVREAYLGSPSQ
jgi:branched-chain amino acid transport system ATP-binding protein